MCLPRLIRLWASSFFIQQCLYFFDVPSGFLAPQGQGSFLRTCAIGPLYSHNSLFAQLGIAGGGYSLLMASRGRRVQKAPRVRYRKPEDAKLSRSIERAFDLLFEETIHVWKSGDNVR